MHCNPITHFDALGLADGDSVQDYQDQIDQADEQIEDLEIQIDAEKEKATKDYNEKVGPLISQLNDINNQKDTLSQSQADLKASGWSRDGVTSISGPRVVDGKPVIKGDISSEHGVRGKATRDAKPDEMHLFKTGSDGSLSAKTFEESSKETLDAINTTAGALTKILNP